MLSGQVYYPKATFIYYYNNSAGDRYSGTVYGQQENALYKGYIKTTPTVSGKDENGQAGYYRITNYTLITDTSQLGQVFVDLYYDAETLKYFDPVGKGQAVGTNGLGSETDFMQNPQVDGHRFGLYDSIFWEADVTTSTPENKFSFKYTYGPSGTEYYTGVVYAGSEKNYYAGQKWTCTTPDENNVLGTYEILIASYDAAITSAQFGQVFVDLYHDAESNANYDPVNKGKAVGLTYLGSELDYLIKIDVPDFKFGQSYWEADVGDTYNFRYTYGNGDYYDGSIYAGPSYGYYKGWKSTKQNKTGKTGTYEITGVSYTGVTISQYGQVLVNTYYDGDMSKKPYQPLNATGPLGTAYLGSEAGYIVKADIPDYYFGKGYDEADVGDKFIFIYTYGNEDYYTGYVYADPAYGYYRGWEKATVNELQETGWYEIIGKSYTGTSASYGKVYVNRYYNGDQDEKFYTPVNAATHLGSTYLGSELGYILKTNVAAFKFGQGKYEADVGDRYNFIYTYNNGDYYSGIVYADPSYGYYPGWKKTQINETGELGWYRITGMSYKGVTSSLYGKVLVKNYFDGSATGNYYVPLAASAYFGTAYLGSEYGYIIELNNPAYKFGGGYDETNGS